MVCTHKKVFEKNTSNGILGCLPKRPDTGGLQLNITDIRIRRTYRDTRLKALVSATIDGDLAVHDIKVIEGPERLFVAMPSRKDDHGAFRDIVHPITPEARLILEDSILNAYHEYLAIVAASETAERTKAD